MLYYSHVNEDNRIEQRLIAEGSFTDLWCISGSGERVISLLEAKGLKNVYAVDINPEALFLLELKLTALQYLSIPGYLEFLGRYDTNKSDRLGQFKTFSSALSEKCRTYWEGQPKVIKKGILHVGHFEQFLSRIRPLLQLWLGRGFYQCFKKPVRDCTRFPHRRWHLLKVLFQYRWVYQLLGNRDDAFVAKDAKRSEIPDALQAVLDQDLVSRSFMFHLVFNGHLREMKEADLPPSLQRSVLEKIKIKLESGQLKIHYLCGDLKNIWESSGPNTTSPVFFSLSDLLSFVDLNYMKTVCQLLKPSMKTGSVMVLRAFLRHALTADQLEWLSQHFWTAHDLSEEERTKMYKVYTFGAE